MWSHLRNHPCERVYQTKSWNEQIVQLLGATSLLQPYSIILWSFSYPIYSDESIFLYGTDEMITTTIRAFSATCQSISNSMDSTTVSKHLFFYGFSCVIWMELDNISQNSTLCRWWTKTIYIIHGTLHRNRYLGRKQFMSFV